jgi:regulator of protease activity HflC (stomatin/prohibitin superfamily)
MKYKTQGQKTDMNIKAKLSFAVIGLGALIGAAAFFGSFFVVGEQERAVVTRAGAYSHVAQPGLNFKIPFVDTAVFVPVTQQQFQTPKLNTYTEDNQEVEAILTVQWRYPPSELEFIYANVGFEKNALLANMIIDRWKVEAGKVNVTTIATNRGALVNAVREVVQREAQRLYRIEVTDIQLTDLEYQPTFREAQARAAVVKTEIEQAQGLRLKAEIEAKTMEIQARAKATQDVEIAKGNAEAIRVRGVAEAETQELMAKAISSNPLLVELRKAERWNGTLPQNIYAGAPIPFLSLSSETK